MIVRNFTDKDVEEASKISHLVWGDLYKKESCELHKLIYDFTLEYYYLNNSFSFALDDNGLKGIVFASSKHDKNNSVENFTTKDTVFYYVWNYLITIERPRRFQ